MAFETNTLVNGEWTTRTLDVDAVLKHFNQKETNIGDLDIETAPTLGLLTQTVVRSPLAHWILQAKLRDPDRNDVAFIGDDFVQIKELRQDTHLWDVIRKENFGARIRNARVFGSMKAHKEQTNDFDDFLVKHEDEDVPMDIEEGLHNGRHEGSELPPQSIILQLDTGDTVFLTLHQSNSGRLEFVSSRHRVPKSMLGLQPGMHLTIDPSSRYMAVGCSEHLFAIYALHSREELSRQRGQESPLRYVESESYFNVQGTILKMDFLHPNPNDMDHIILLVLYVAKGKTRMLLYEWETGNDLAKLRPRIKKGHQMAPELQMPLLLIPLTIKSSFILVFETFIAVCVGLLEGSLEFNIINQTFVPPTDLYHGKGFPVWTTWARPSRLDKHTLTKDDIYVVREDGVLKFLEIDVTFDELVGAEHKVGYLNGNCGKALASLDHKNYGQTGDMLITGGDSCAGGMYLIKAREFPKFIEPIQNWSPSPDFVTTCATTEHRTSEERGRRKKPFHSSPDKIFACAGKGSNGVITEFRHGLEAKLGIEMDYQVPIIEAWALYPTFDPADGDNGASLFLLSLGDHSAVLQLSGDAGSVRSLEQNNTKFDLRYRTVAANMSRSATAQVTEQSIVLVNGSQVYVHGKEEILEVREDGIVMGYGPTIDKAIIHEELILFTTHFNHAVYIQILERRDTDDMETDGVSSTGPQTKVRTLGKYSPQLTGLAICGILGSLCAIVTEEGDDSIVMIFEAIKDTKRQELKIPLAYGEEIRLEAFVSIAVAYLLPGIATFLCGTRNGFLLTLNVNESTLQITTSRCDRLGVSQVMITKDVQSNSGELFFVNCDSKVFVLAPRHSVLPSDDGWNPGWAINQLWVTDANRPGFQQPEITTMARLPPKPSEGPDGSILLVAGTQLLIAAFSTQAKTVPRHIAVGGTPTRLLYSNAMDLLIVGAIVDNKSTLLFIDPETGDNLSAPLLKRDSEPADYPNGLGKSGDKIYHLLEWSFVKENKTWDHIIVATSSGKLLVVSTKDEGRHQNGASPFNGADTRPRRTISFWTKHIFKSTGSEPVYSVTGFADGLLWCSGNKLLCDTLDIKDKKFKRIVEYELPSPAISITYDNGIVYALTNSHSLEVLRLTLDGVGGPKITRTHGDQVTRNGLHHATITQPLGRPINFVSDKHCSVVGLWPTQDTKADTLETVFEAELSHSILKFRSGRCRPLWDPCWTSSGFEARSISTGDGASPETVPRSANRSELLGISIDGSLSQYTVLDVAEWRFLRFILNLAIRSSKVCGFTYNDDHVSLEPPSEPKLMMHVDGDILKRCLVDRVLEELLHINEESQGAGRIFSKFFELLQDLHGGKLKEHVDARVYVEQAYTDLAFYLRPAL